MQQITITEIKTNVVNTKYGEKKKYLFYHAGNTSPVSVWEGSQANAVKAGDTIEIDITENVYNGRTYFNGKFPNSGKADYSGLTKDLAEIKQVLNGFWKDLKEVKTRLHGIEILLSARNKNHGIVSDENPQIKEWTGGGNDSTSGF